jgi:hypothetical protein
MQAAEGAFASLNPRAVLLAGSSMFKAADDGLAVARFAWADRDTGFAANTRTGSHQLLGFVLPVVNGWAAVRITRGQRYIRPGVGVTLMKSADVWVRFYGGARAGQPVYASLVDGRAISGEADGAELTPWFVVTNVQPGGLAIISTTCKVTS